MLILIAILPYAATAALLAVTPVGAVNAVASNTWAVASSCYDRAEPNRASKSYYLVFAQNKAYAFHSGFPFSSFSSVALNRMLPAVWKTTMPSGFINPGAAREP